MSRIGKMPIPVPKGVEVRIAGDSVSVKGPLGTLSREMLGVKIEQKDDALVVSPDENHPKSQAMWGLMRTLVSNLVEGVSKGFTRKLVITGIGYRAEESDNGLTLHLGYSNPIDFPLPEAVTSEVGKKGVNITLKSIDNEILGDVAARIRALRPVEPYRGKGVAYEGEKIRRKEGKAAAGGVG
ncbi:MAG: 50S ribosomal protein L6 [Deltaproteobacteria bacterium]|nr:50S ribosomal protein L6 [Deltaproteobacteria bacterium]